MIRPDATRPLDSQVPARIDRRDSFTLWDRAQISCLSSLGWALVSLIGSTLRYRVEGWGRVEQLERESGAVILSFWHNQILPATHFWRFRNIAVLTSRHFDGECIGRIIEKFGYVPARGSSGKGAVRALLELRKHLKTGANVAFTIDGPRGPRYRVKPGPLWLSRKTGLPILCFHVEPKQYWELKSWDGFRIPKPFTPVLLKIGRPLFVTMRGGELAWLERFQDEMDRLRRYCEGYWVLN